jgi:hypothetical protein
MCYEAPHSMASSLTRLECEPANLGTLALGLAGRAPLWFSYALCNHFGLCQTHHLFSYEPDDPPFTELILLFLGLGGCYVVGKESQGSWPRGTGWVSLLFTALAYSGWYWTEILYDRLIIYSFYASQHLPLK